MSTAKATTASTALQNDQPPAFDPSSLISMAEAARRIPSPRAGKRTHLATVYRLIDRHLVPIERRGRWRFLTQEAFELLISRMFAAGGADSTGAAPARAAPRSTGSPRPKINIKPTSTSAWARGVLDRAGIVRPGEDALEFSRESLKGAAEQ